MRKVLVILVLLTCMGFLGCQAAEETTTTTTVRVLTTTCPVKIMQAVHDRQSSYVVASGKVWNDGKRTVRGVLMRATAYTEGGKVVNTDTAYIDSDMLAPGASSTFKILVADPGKEATKCRVGVESYR